MNPLSSLLLPSERSLLDPAIFRALEGCGIQEQHSCGLDAVFHRRGPWVVAAIGRAAGVAEGIPPSRFELWHDRVGLVVGGDRSVDSCAGVAVTARSDDSSGAKPFPTESRTGLAGRWIFLEQASGFGAVRFRFDLDEDSVAGINVDWSLVGAARLSVRIPAVVPSGAKVVIDSETTLAEEPGVFPVRQRVGIAGGDCGAGHTLIIPAGVPGQVQYPTSASDTSALFRLARVMCFWEDPMLHGFSRIVVRVE